MLASLDQRIHEREAADHRERDAGGVETRARGRRRGPRQVAAAGGDRQQSDRNVDEEDRPPAGPDDVEVDQRAADERAGDRGQAHDRTEHAERLLLTLVAEQLADQSEPLRDHDRGHRALKRPPGDQRAG